MPAADAGTQPGVDGRTRDAVAALLRVAATRYVDLGYLAPGGTLDLAIDSVEARSVRLELPGTQVLELQSLGLDVDDVDDPRPLVQVEAGSWADDIPQPVDLSRLLDVDAPSGTCVQTGAGGPAWVEVRLARPLTLRRLRLRTGERGKPGASAGLRVEVRTRWRTRTIHDGAARLRAWRGELEAARAAGGDLPEARTLLDVVDLTVRGEYRRAHQALVKRLDDADLRAWFRDAVNELLAGRDLEWTSHGPQRPFRRWSERERVAYVEEASVVVEALRSLTPEVCLGFGSVLAVVRDRALIPHDDDLDIIVALEPAVAATILDGLGLVEAHLVARGFEVAGAFATHRHVSRDGRKPVDVFVGIVEGDRIAWYPGPRDGVPRRTAFPATASTLLGVPCLVPANPEAYLECVYGPGWRVPDPQFSHNWDLSAYADISGR